MTDIPIESGERLGYGITMLVAMEVGKFVLVGVVPISGEILQLMIITAISTLFCYFALFQVRRAPRMHHRVLS